jgi:hypothetical protein
MATVDALKRPTVRFQHAGKFLPGKGLHNASSIT